MSFESKRINTSKDNNEIIFNNHNGWVLKITKEGNFEFNHETKMNADEFAKEFIRILEESIIKR